MTPLGTSPQSGRGSVRACGVPWFLVVGYSFQRERRGGCGQVCVASSLRPVGVSDEPQNSSVEVWQWEEWGLRGRQLQLISSSDVFMEPLLK